MGKFKSALVKAVLRYGVWALIGTAMGGFVLWVLDQELGNRIANFLDAHIAGLGMWIKANPVSSVVVAGVIFVAFCALMATQDEWIRKLSEFMREPDVASLAIIWTPGESVFVHPYTLPPDPTINLEFRICVVNTSQRTTLTGIRVRLQDLHPYELPCVPCGLRLMNNTKEPIIDRFDLHPQEEQFVSVFVQKPNASTFWFLHTTQGIPWTVPAQPYVMKIVASCGLARTEQRLELVKSGLQWEMKAV